MLLSDIEGEWIAEGTDKKDLISFAKKLKLNQFIILEK